MSKLDQVKKQVEQELAEVVRARAELRDQDLLLRADEVGLRAKLKLLSGEEVEAPEESLSDRILRIVRELGEASPARLVERDGESVRLDSCVRLRNPAPWRTGARPAPRGARGRSGPRTSA